MEEYGPCNQFLSVKALTLLCSTVELLHSLYRTLRMQSVKHGCCTLVFYFSKLDCKNCFLITVGRFAFLRFVLGKGLSYIFVTYGNALWFTVLIGIVNISYFFFPLLFLSSSAVVAFICSANAYSRACSIASRRQQFWHRATIPVTALCVCAGGSRRMWIAATEMGQALLFQTAFSILFRSNTRRGHL